MNLAGRIFRKIIPRPISYPLTCFKILELDYAHLKSVLKWSCIDRNGNPIPWYTYPAIEYLTQLDFSGKTVFEYGSGNSSLFWAARSEKVVSIENNRKWHTKISSNHNFKNLSIILEEENDLYVKSIADHGEFDVIIIDGSHREECAHYAIKYLNPGGFVILDNSDWFPEVAQFLRESLNLIQVDMKGFAPINFYTSTTSIFFHRDFNLSAKDGLQPSSGIGSIEKRG